MCDICQYAVDDYFDKCPNCGKKFLKCPLCGKGFLKPIKADDAYALLADVRAVLQEALECIEDAQNIYGSGDRDEAVVENIKNFISEHFTCDTQNSLYLIKP